MAVGRHLQVWWPAENNMVGCDSCDFWIHDGCDFEAARILANGASDAEPYNCPMCRSSHQAQVRLLLPTLAAVDHL